MVIYRILAGVILFSTITRCTNRPNSISTLEPTELRSFNQFHIDQVAYPWDIVVADTLLAILDDKDPIGVIKVFDIKSEKYIGAIGERGRGPNELINPHTLAYTNASSLLWIASTPPGKIYGFDLKMLIKQPETKGIPTSTIEFPKDYAVVSFSMINDSLYAIMKSSVEHNVSIVNSSGNIINQLVCQPLPAKHSPIHNEELFLRHIVLDPDSQYIFSAFIMQDIIVRTSLRDGACKEFVFPNYEPILEGYEVSKKESDRISFRQLRIKNELLYLSYLGAESWDYKNQCEILPKTILVFDRQLNPLYKYILPYGIVSFDIDESGKIYAITDYSNAYLLVFDTKNQ